MKKPTNEFLVKKEAKDPITEGIFDSFRKTPEKKLKQIKLDIAQMSTKINAMFDDLTEMGMAVPPEVEHMSLLVQKDMISLSNTIDAETGQFVTGGFAKADKKYKDIKFPKGPREPGFPTTHRLDRSAPDYSDLVPSQDLDF